MKTPSILLAALAIFATLAAIAPVATANPTPCPKIYPRAQVPTQVLLRPQALARERSTNFAIAPLRENIDVKTHVIVDDGSTAVLGGLTEEASNDAQDQVPTLGKIPFINRLFKNKRADDKSETIILVTPRIITQEEGE